MTLPLSFVIPRAAKESQKEKTQAKPPRQFECFIRSMRIKCIENQQNIDKCHSEPACRFTCPRHGRQGSMTKESQKANRTNHNCDADLKASVEGISKKKKPSPNRHCEARSSLKNISKTIY